MSKQNKKKAPSGNVHETGSVVSGVILSREDGKMSVNLLGGGKAYIKVDNEENDFSWHPDIDSVTMFNCENLEVKGVVLDYDSSKGLYRIGVKQLRPNPWPDIEKNYPVGKKFKVVTSRCNNFDNTTRYIFFDYSYDVDVVMDLKSFNVPDGFDFKPYIKKGRPVEVELMKHMADDGALMVMPVGAKAKTQEELDTIKAEDERKNKEILEASRIERRKHIQVPDYDRIMSTKDVFEKYRVAVDEALTLHKNARKLANLRDNGLTEAINRKAMPFIKGNFTLAVVGKMSAGKSTFLNALLGTSHLLPTGYLQTTCAITIVEHSDTPHVIVQYGDGHEEKITDDLGSKLRGHVAIPDEYNDLPVNQINRLILAGKTTAEITSPDMIDELECVAKCHIEPQALKKYIAEHPKGTIPVLVKVYTRMPEGYRGWRIVDTPGVDAIGGIEDETRAFLCGKDKDGNNNVDAIVFIQKGTANIQDSGLNEFVENTIQDLSDEAKGRVFFVLTHGSLKEFRNHQDEVLTMAKKLFIDYGDASIDDDRLEVVDSLTENLHKDLVDNCEDVLSYLDDDVPGPDRWISRDWNDCRDVLFDVERILSRKLKVDVLNESMLEQLKKLANFDGLREKLTIFAAKEKKKTFVDLINTIHKDIMDCIQLLFKDIKVWEMSLGSSPAEYRAKLEEEKKKLADFQLDVNTYMNKIQTDYGRDQVSARFRTGLLGNNFLTTLRAIKTTNGMVLYANSVQKEAIMVQVELFKEIKDKVRQHIDQSMTKTDVALPSIDFDKLEQMAEEKGVDVVLETKKVEKPGITGLFARGLGAIFNTSWGYEIVTVERKEPNKQKQLEEFAVLVAARISMTLNTYVTAVNGKVNEIVLQIDKAMKEKIANAKAHYEDIANKSDIAANIDEAHNTLRLLSHYSEEAKEFYRLKIEEI